MESVKLVLEKQDFSSIQEKLTATHNFVLDLIKEYGVLYPKLSSVDEFKSKVDKMNNLLTSIDKELNFLKEVVTSQNDSELPTIKSKYPELGDSYNALNSKNDLSLVSLGSSLQFMLTKLLPDAKETVEASTKVVNSSKDSMNFAEAVADLNVIASKFETVFDLLSAAALYNKNDIFGQDSESETWKTLLEKCHIKKPVPVEAIRKQMKRFSRMANMANAVVSKKEKNPKALDGHFSVAMKAFYYSNNEEEAKKEAAWFLSEAKLDSMMKVLSMQDNALIQKFAELQLPSIQYDKVLYLEKLFPKIDKEFIMNEYKNGTINKIKHTDFEAPDVSDRKKDILDKIFEQKPNSVRVRILSAKQLVLQGRMGEKIAKSAKGFLAKIAGPISSPYKDGINGIIFHVHGGGFVAFSSATHRNHTITWAKTLDKIIFSVDYGLAPNNPYPMGLDDVWQAYNWVINYAEEVLGIKTEKVIVAGDSAGGNLIMGLTMMCIKTGVRPPDGCLMLYPAVNLDQDVYSPSYFIALDDPMLPYSLLKLCGQAYIPEEFKKNEDPFISPLYASDELISKLPPCIIAGGTNDPLHDDAWRFLHRLVKAKVSCKLYLYPNMPHGFVSMGRMQNYDLIVAETCGMLRELLEHH